MYYDGLYIFFNKLFLIYTKIIHYIVYTLGLRKCSRIMIITIAYKIIYKSIYQ